jgi:hypothetical protein
LGGVGQDEQHGPTGSSPGFRPPSRP